MNPGNGIETDNQVHQMYNLDAFKLMNPGNGIETSFWRGFWFRKSAFQINESWQRDWNRQ